MIDEDVCGSVFQDADPDVRHLCNEEDGHLSDHICWAGVQCATWTNDQERKPRMPIQKISRAWDEEKRIKMRGRK